MLSFDPEKHEYRIDGAIVPSVTEIIRTVLPGWKVDDWYLTRGKAVHFGCHLLDRGELDWASVATEIQPRIRAWEKFRNDFDYPVVANELPVVSRRHRFAGTLDRVFDCLGDMVLVDLKNSISPQVKLQLAAYALASQEIHPGVNGLPIAKAAAVELREDGSYSALWLNKTELRLMGQTFLACLTIHNFMKANGLKGSSNGDG